MKNISLLNKLYIKYTLKRIRLFIKELYFLKEHNKHHVLDIFSKLYVQSIRGEEKYFIGHDKYERALCFSYYQIRILSKLMNNDLFEESEKIEYLFLLNNFINTAEEKIDKEIINIVALFKKEDGSLISFVKKQINFNKHEKMYKEKQKNLKIFLKFFRKNVSEHIFRIYYPKLNLRTWEDMVLKIKQRLEEKEIDLAKEIEIDKIINKSNSKKEDIEYQQEDYSTINHYKEDQKNQQLLNIVLMTAVG